MLKVCEVPGHPLADAVTTIVDVMGLELVLFAVNAGIFPVPVAVNPMDVLLFVQE